MTVTELIDLLRTMPAAFEVFRHDSEWGARPIQGVSIKYALGGRHHLWVFDTEAEALETADASEQIFALCEMR